MAQAHMFPHFDKPLNLVQASDCVDDPEVGMRMSQCSSFIAAAMDGLVQKCGDECAAVMKRWMASCQVPPTPASPLLSFECSLLCQVSHRTRRSN